MFPVILWLLVVGGLTAQCMVTDACRFKAYGDCVRSAGPNACEGLLPEEWRR